MIHCDSAPHSFRSGPADGPLLTFTCRNCGATRELPTAAPDRDAKNTPVLARRSDEAPWSKNIGRLSVAPVRQQKPRP